MWASACVALCLITGSIGLQRARPGLPCPDYPDDSDTGGWTGTTGSRYVEGSGKPCPFPVLCFCQRFVPASYEYCKEVSQGDQER